MRIKLTKTKGEKEARSQVEMHSPPPRLISRELCKSHKALPAYQLEAGQRNFAHIHWTSFSDVDKPCF